LFIGVGNKRRDVNDAKRTIVDVRLAIVMRCEVLQWFEVVIVCFPKKEGHLSQSVTVTRLISGSFALCKT
jgi:hypothetical protein